VNPEALSRTHALFNSLKEHCGKELLFVDQPKGQQPSKYLVQLREWLSDKREERRSGYMNEEGFLKAYCSFYLPLHLPEVYWVLAQNVKRSWPFAPAKKLLDVGCGPGTATLSYLLFCLHNNLPTPSEIHLVDTSKAALALAKSLVLVLAPDAKVSLHRTDLRNTRELTQVTRTLGRKMDLVLMSHVLNEFGSGPRSRDSKGEFIDRILLSCCDEHGHLLVVEPPLRSPTMDLMKLRDELTEKGAVILAPCPSGTTHCPMLRGSAGWCYAQPPREEARSWEIAPWDKAIGRLLGIEVSHPGFSYLLIGMQPEEKHATHTAISISDESSGMICNGKMIKHSTVPYRGAYLEKAPAESAPSNPPKKPSVR
jgi:SAM-dependent methyltransferase